MSLGDRAVTYSNRRKFPLPVVEYPDGVERPRTRGDCLPGGHNAERPCPFVSCRFHLAIDVTHTGSIKLNFPNDDVDEIPQTCALDVADRGGEILEKCASYMNLTRERIRQLQDRALSRLPRGGAFGDYLKRSW
jgi:hypothetical protein